MAISFTNAIANAVGTTDVIVFTAPSKSIVVGGSVTNILSSTVPMSIKVRRGVTDTHVHKDKRIEVGVAYELMSGNKLVLASGDKIIVSSQVASSIDVVFSIMQGVS
jgi:hypothetical protein